MNLFRLVPLLATAATALTIAAPVSAKPMTEATSAPLQIGVMLPGAPADSLLLARRGRGADDPAGHIRRGRGRGTDDPAGHAAAPQAPADGLIFARQGRGADDPAGHVRRGRGADDPAGHTRRGRGADDPAGHA